MTESIVKKRVTNLYRVSTCGQIEKDDIPMQKISCRDFAEKQGWEVVAEYSEKGVSGYKVSANDRDAIQDIRKSALAKEFDIFLVFMFDRLGRKDDETPFVLEWFVKNGIEVWSVNEGQQRFDSHVDHLMNYIRFWQASGESEKTSIRTKTRHAQIVQEDKFRGGIAPFGFELIKSGRQNRKNQDVNDLYIHETESPIVKKIFDLYSNCGMGTHQIAMHLTAQGIPSRSGSWHPSTILNMLKNPTYKGILRSSNSYSDPFPHLQIISSELFDRAQTLIQQRAKKSDCSPRQPITAKTTALLAGNIFCAHCGGRLTPSTAGKKGHTRKDGTAKMYDRHIYVCYNQSRKRKDCDGNFTYRVHRVDAIVNETIMELFRKLKDTPQQTAVHSLY